MESAMAGSITAGVRQRGASLLEAMIGILIFSVGILALVGMQALAIKHMSDAKYRSDAAFYANEIIAQIWVNRANLSSYEFTGSGAWPPVLDSWVYSIKDGENRLPGVTAAANLPIVSVSGTRVTVTVRWTLPGGSSDHKHITIAYING
jgi:type IV pilus assembly protein PilV